MGHRFTPMKCADEDREWRIEDGEKSVAILHPLSSLVLCAAIVLLALFASLTASARIPEPGTVFYGKIVNRTSGQEYVLTEGTISWTINKPDGGRMILIGKVEDFKNGEFSYRMTVPHEARASVD